MPLPDPPLPDGFRWQDPAFIGALYDEQTTSIQIPYMHEEGEMRQLESFPLGEGLTSILLRNKKPLLIVEDAEEQTKAFTRTTNENTNINEHTK